MSFYNILHNSSKILHPTKGGKKKEERERREKEGREERKERRKGERASILPILLSTRFAVCVCESLMSNMENLRPPQHHDAPLVKEVWTIRQFSIHVVKKCSSCYSRAN